jgi:hypothetical protein
MGKRERGKGQLQRREQRWRRRMGKKLRVPFSFSTPQPRSWCCPVPPSSFPIGAALRPRGNANLTRLGPKRSSMINLQPALVLPLMHHLMEERLERFVPPMPTQMPAADHDLGWLTGRRRGAILSEMRPQATRHADAEGPQSSAEEPRVVLRMPRRETLGMVAIVGM